MRRVETATVRPDGKARPATKPKRKITLRRNRPLRDGLLAAMARIVAASRRGVRTTGSDPVAAVHEYRKAVRRALAVVSLLRPSLGKRASRGLAKPFRGALHDTGSLRDAGVLLQALRRLPSELTKDPAAEAAETIFEERRRVASEEGPTAEVLTRSAATLRPIPAALGVVLTRDFSPRDIERGLSRSAKRTRRALDHALETHDPVEFHEWRKLVKELRYQIELLASGVELRAREKALGKFVEEMGKTTDLILLLREVETLAREGKLEGATAWTEQIRALVLQRCDALMLRGQSVFSEAPRRLARQILAERG